jgi:hypothetical protein
VRVSSVVRDIHPHLRGKISRTCQGRIGLFSLSRLPAAVGGSTGEWSDKGRGAGAAATVDDRADDSDPGSDPGGDRDFRGLASRLSQLTITLLRDIGVGEEVHWMDEDQIRRAAAWLHERELGR